MKLIYFLLGIIASIITPYLTWLISSITAHYLLNLSAGMFIALLLFLDPIIIGLIIGAATIIHVPLCYCIQKCNMLKWFSLPLYCFFAYSTVALPWHILTEFGFWEIVFTIHFIIFYLIIYGAFMWTIFKSNPH